MDNIIRHIELHAAYVDAWVIRDTDDDQLLCIVVYDEEGPVYEKNIGIDWLEKTDPKRVDWLALVYGCALRKAYRTGVNDTKKIVHECMKTLTRM